MPWCPDPVQPFVLCIPSSLRVLLGLLLAALLPPAELAQPSSVPSLSTARSFMVGERFTYALSWLAIRAGTAVLEVSEAPPVQDRKTVRLLTTATSSPFVTTFYPVDNRVETLVDAETLVPYRMLFRRREGKRVNDFDVIFRHAEGTVTSNKDGVVDTIPVPPDTYDEISCLYYVRSLPSLSSGSSVVLNVHHEKKNYRLEVRVEGIETLQGPWGTVETLRVLAIMPFQGIFLNEGNIQVWLTNDARRVPVMMKAKVKIGSVVAKLVDGFRMPPS